MEWVNNKDLKIEKAMLQHDGNYTCSDNNGNSKTAEVDVQYFSTSASLSVASTANTTAVFTCRCHSNPPCKIHPYSVSHDADSKTKFFPCKPDPTTENRMECKATVTLGLAKRYNGLTENRCEFKYKDIEKYATQSARNVFYFPPTNVDVTAKKVGQTVTLNCTTDSSNPVALLKWYKGNKDEASDNTIITSNYRRVIEDAEYNGKSVSQLLNINVKSIKDGEKAFCCGKQVQTEICESISLAPFRETSGGHSLTAGMTLIIVGIAIIIL
ncbi:uncharacterized protein LOC132714910 isoform X2 [Ruditapes philippinarum]|nr:uncharacterized protein LOC132714910 isoform X2 [Ruditapes philippinarum]